MGPSGKQAHAHRTCYDVLQHTIVVAGLAKSGLIQHSVGTAYKVDFYCTFTPEEKDAPMSEALTCLLSK